MNWPRPSNHRIDIAEGTRTSSEWNASRLCRHPGLDRPLEVNQGRARLVSEQDVNYEGVLDANTRVLLWCPPHDNRQLYVRIVREMPSEDSWMTVRGKVTNQDVLAAGDLLTIGQYAWVLHVYAEGNGVGLEPVDPMHGATIEFNDLQVGNRLDIDHLGIGAGELVAVTGPSGAGKSTLITELAGHRCGRGEVRIGNVSRNESHDPAIYQIAYVPQQDIVHADLTIAQQVIDYVGLTCSAPASDEAERALRMVGLRDLTMRFPDQISGGQLRRARLAAAISRGPTVLVLDEPDSGLDPATAALIRGLLKTFSLLGMTVVTITHHYQEMTLFDRVIRLQDGRVTQNHGPDLSSGDSTNGLDVSNQNDGDNRPSWLSQMARLVKREGRFLWQGQLLDRLQPLPPDTSIKRRGQRRLVEVAGLLTRQLMILTVWMPLLFAISVAVASPTVENGLRSHLVGFLSVLSVIWMAASASHLSFTSTFKRTQFERLQGLNAYSLLLAKTIVLSFVGIVQTSIYLCSLILIRHAVLGEPAFYGKLDTGDGVGVVAIHERFFDQLDEHVWYVYGVLILVAVAATQLGLLISAASRGRSRVAAVVLPLVMMFQIVFSPFVIRADQSKLPAEDVYAGFWWHKDCEGIAGCPSRLIQYQASGRYLCSLCEERAEDGDSSELDDRDISDRIADNSQVPSRFATGISLASLTRHADLATRPFLGASNTEQDEINQKADVAFWEIYLADLTAKFGWGTLLGMAIAFHTATLLLSGSIRMPRFRAKKSSRATIIYLVLCFGACGGGSLGFAQEVSDQSVLPNLEKETIRLPVRDGKYDASSIGQLSHQAETDTKTAVWIPLTEKTKAGLWLLKLAGTIKDYQVSDREIRLSIPSGDDAGKDWSDVRKALFPPQLIGVDEIGEHRQLVILIHGLEGGRSTYRYLKPMLVEAGWYPLEMVYPNDGGIKEPAEFLRDQIREIAVSHPNCRIALISHSMGGLVAWSALSREAPTVVTDLFTLGTPYAGSCMAHFQSDLELVDVAARFLAFDRASWEIERDGSGEAIEVLRPDSVLRRECLANELPSHVRVHIAAGNSGPIQSSDRQRWTSGLQRRIELESTPPRLVEDFKVLLEAEEMLDGLGDGAVTVASAMAAPRFDSRKVFRVSHTGLLRVDRNDDIKQWLIDLLGSR
ncbi:ATP-binding cassette domain-containing protein [Roseimaritima multifibrata]|nr:ATP-binding cassette domain-containing protein [Roseimaritima multifibrata]